MSVLLALILVGVAAQPPALPPDPPTSGPAPAGDGATPPASTNEHADASTPATVEHDAQGDEPRANQPAPDSGPVAPPQSGTRPPLPAGLQPVPFPLEQTRAAPTQSAPPSQTSQRSIVDLRDPFSRPPTRPIPRADREAASRLLMPDLKDPFAPEVRRVRSQTLDQSVPNDIRDPFRDRPRPPNPPPCARGDNGVVVQTPGGECGRSAIDLRDPFSR